MSSAAHAQALRLRLFLEGIEVPVIAANVQTAPNSPSVATIQIPPLADATRLHPRTTVHLFFLDLYRTSPAINDTGRNAQAPDTSTRPPNEAEREQQRLEQGFGEDAAAWAATADSMNDQWRLLFGGEVIGFTWTKNTSNRSVILQCEDWSNYWDYAYQSSNTDIFGPGLKAVFSGSATNLFTDFLQSEGEVLTNIICSGKCNTFPQLKGLAAGIIRLIEAISGSFYVYPQGNRQQPPKRRAGQNAFFSYNELRLHITQMVGTYETDPTSERIMRRGGYGGMFSRALGGQGGQVSIRKAITAVTRVIFYEMYPQPCPKYKPGNYGEVTGTKRVKLKDHPELGRFATAAAEGVAGLEDLSERLDRFVNEQDYPPPTQGGSTDFLQGGTSGSSDTYQARLRRLADQQVRELSNMYRFLQRTISQMRNAPKEASGAMTSASRKVGLALSKAQQLRGTSFSNNPSSADAKRTELRKLQQEAIEELNRVENVDALVGTGSDRKPAQLYQQVFRPDVWFASPPRCNVLFPELYDTFNYQRTFLQEPTRFMLKTNDEFFGEDVLFDQLYFAPQAGTVEGNRSRMSTMIKGELLMHERFTGILPIFEKMGEFNIFASRAEGVRKGSGKVGLAQRSANFLYFRHRFNSRRATVSGKFNPYVAVGCPGLIIDKYVDQATIDRHNELRREANVPEIDAGQLLGTNFLGNFTQVVHQVSNPQPVGMTDITLTFPRQPDENVEYLGSIPEELQVRTRVDGGEATRSTDIAAISPPQLYSLGPNRGRITNVQQVSDQYQDGRRLKTFMSGVRRDTNFKPIEVPISEPIKASTFEGNSEALADLLGGPDTVGVFQAYRVTEEIPRYRREEVILPAEEYIRPGWYGETWTNSQIGQVWQDLFSTGSITDPISINDYGRSSTSLRSEESQLAAAEQEDAEAADDPKVSAPALMDLQEGASLSQAIEFLHLTYSYIKQAGLDVDEFIGAYTWRPIATLLDMFGTSDLVYDAGGENIVQGYEGFHSRAFGPYDNLFGLVDAEIEDVLGVKRGSTAAQKIDVRKERRQQVEKYVTTLLFGNALLG